KKESEISYANFTDMGFNRLIKLPFTQETSDGLKLTVHSAYLYKTSSAEGKALQEKYSFTQFDKAKDILIMNFTLENNTGRVVQENYHDMNAKFYVAMKEGVTMAPAVSRIYNKNENDTTYIRDYRLENGEKITSNVAFLNVTAKDIDFIGIGTKFKAGSNYQDIAEKVN